LFFSLFFSTHDADDYGDADVINVIMMIMLNRMSVCVVGMGMGM
jgi:hypothetical protein